MKIKFHLDSTERKYVCEFLLNVTRKKRLRIGITASELERKMMQK